MTDQYILPIMGFLIGIGSVIITLCYIRILAKNLIEKIDFAEEASDLLDDRLDHIVEKLRDQLPMGGTLVTGVLSEKLKSYGKSEIVKMMPELKEKLYNRSENSSFSRDILLMIALGGAFGLIVGAIAGYVWLR